MKIIITEKQLNTLVEEKEVSNELLFRIWNTDLGPEIFETLTSYGFNYKTINDIMKDSGYDGLYNLLMDNDETELARRMKMFVRKSNSI